MEIGKTILIFLCGNSVKAKTGKVRKKQQSALYRHGDKHYENQLNVTLEKQGLEVILLNDRWHY